MPRILSLLLVAVFTLVLPGPTALAQATSDGGATVQRDLQRATIANATFFREPQRRLLHLRVSHCEPRHREATTGPPNAAGALYLSVDDFDCLTGVYRGTSFFTENLTQRDFATQFPTTAHLDHNRHQL